MVENFAANSRADDVARVYLGIVTATAGQPLAIVEAALAMSLTLIGEQRGLTAAALVDWIETVATAAAIAAQRDAADPVLRPTDIIARESLN